MVDRLDNDFVWMYCHLAAHLPFGKKNPNCNSKERYPGNANASEPTLI